MRDIASRVELLTKSGELAGARELVPELALRYGDLQAAAQRFADAAEVLK